MIVQVFNKFLLYFVLKRTFFFGIKIGFLKNLRAYKYTKNIEYYKFNFYYLIFYKYSKIFIKICKYNKKNDFMTEN